MRSIGPLERGRGTVDADIVDAGIVDAEIEDNSVKWDWFVSCFWITVDADGESVRFKVRGYAESVTLSVAADDDTSVPDPPEALDVYDAERIDCGGGPGGPRGPIAGAAGL